MKNPLFIKTISVIAILVACSCSGNFKSLSDNSSEKKDDIIVATYKNGNITKSQLSKELDRLKSQNPKIADANLDNLAISQQELLIKEMILKEAALKQAKKIDLNDEKEYRELLKEFETTILQKQLYLKLAKDASSDEKVLAKYNELVQESKDKKDLKFGFILLKDEKEASDLHQRLLKYPNSFSYYAKTKSLDEATKKNDGIIDYSIESSFPDNIVKIVKNLEKDQISTPFAIGNKWAIIKLLDTRKAKIKSFEESKTALSQNMALKAIKDFNDKVIEEAKINLIVR